MPGPLTYAAITLLARDRIGQIKRALDAKKAAGNAGELELHVLHLATEAEKMMSAPQPVIEPPVRLYGPPLTDHVSRFTLLGAVGPDLPRYAAFFAPAQRWLFDMLHKGTADENRERASAHSTDLVFDFYRRVNTQIDIDMQDADKRLEAKLKMQAYVMGHVCHIAADVLAHPYFESVEARLAAPAVPGVPGAPGVLGVPPTPAILFMTRDQVAASLDVRMSDQFFSRGTDTRTKKWADWFPTAGDVPNAFDKAMSDSIIALYTARAPGLPAFEEEFGKVDPAPAPVSPALIRESVESFRNIIEIERVWTLADWLGVTAAMFLPMSLAYFGALVLPQGKNLSRDLTPADPPDTEDIRTYESIVYPVAVSSLGPLVSMIIVTASGRGLSAEGVTGWIQAGLSLVASIGFFATLGGAGAARWTLWFAIPLVLAVAQAIFVIARGAKENSRKALFLGPIVQVALALIFMLLYRVWLHNGVEELDKKSEDRNYLEAIGDFVGWLSIVAALWVGHALLWRYFFSATVADDPDLLVSDPREFLQLYDDTSLVHDLGVAAASERLSDLSYPPTRRPILKMWWEPVGGSTLQVRIDKHDRIVFHWPASPAGSDRTVFAPLSPITIEHWATLLATAVTGNGAIGQLKTKPARDDEKTIELAAGALFADNGDDKQTLADHNTGAAALKDVGATEAAAFTLFHTPRPRLAERMGKRGVVADIARADETPTKAGLLLQPVGGATPRLYRATLATDGTSPFLRSLFRPGDVLEIASAPPARRIVESVDSDTDVTLSSAFPPTIVFPAAGFGYKRVAIDRAVRQRGASSVSTPNVAVGIGPNDIQVDNSAIFFGSEFVVGDIVEIGNLTFQRRRVVAVKDSTPVGTAPAVPTNLLELDAPLSPAAGGASGNLSLLQLAPGPNPAQYHATNDSFGGDPALNVLFAPGDVIELVPAGPPGGPPGERQTIVQVLNSTDIVVAAPFATVISAAGIGYKRASFIDRVSELDVAAFPLIADPSDVFGDGESVMNDAADLAALLCLGAASRMQPNNTPVVPDGATKPVHRVSQVFRNWNLDRRRINEWKLMVSGGAESERRGDFSVMDEAVSVDAADAGEAFSAALITQRTAADAIVREHGWLGVFRSWVDMASRARTVTTDTEVFRPGAPSNRDLSRAMAYLLDSAEGVTP